MQIIFNIIVALASLFDKAIYWRPFWNSLIPFKAYTIFIKLSLYMNSLQSTVWFKMWRITFWLHLDKIADYVGKKRELSFCRNFRKIGALVPADVNREWEKMLKRVN